MSEHIAEIDWSRSGRDFGYENYSRNHEWRFQNGVKIEASATSQFLGDDTKIDPEEAFVASLSSCHMLTFLAICSRKDILVESYTDNAVGYLEKNEAGQLVISRVELHPRIEFGAVVDMSKVKLAALHDQSHRECFLANSVNTEIATILQ